jgi:intraflagellar transport protein 88
MEKRVKTLVHESCLAAKNGDIKLALEKAKEAGKRERQIAKQKEQANIADQVNLDLTYFVLFNLANQYFANKLYQEALNAYAVIVKNKAFNQSGRLRVKYDFA